MIDTALEKVEKSDLDIYTFSFYHDHESGYITVCIDSRENSEINVKSQNRFSSKYFTESISNKDLKNALLWQANTGRNLSLGDFSAVNVVSIEINPESISGDDFYLSMVDAIQAKTEKIRKLSKSPDDIIYTCSTMDNEVGLIWA